VTLRLPNFLIKYDRNRDPRNIITERSLPSFIIVERRRWFALSATTQMIRVGKFGVVVTYPVNATVFSVNPGAAALSSSRYEVGPGFQCARSSSPVEDTLTLAYLIIQKLLKPILDISGDWQGATVQNKRRGCEIETQISDEEDQMRL